MIPDNIVEADETVIVLLTDTDNTDVNIDPPNNNATVTITDNDTATVSIAKTTDGNEAGPVSGVFTVTQTAASSTDTILSYSVGGTATSGSDYTALPSAVTIPAGATSAPITVAVNDDSLVEPNETVIVTLTGITAGDAGYYV